MRLMRFALIVVALALAGESCAPVVRYHPQPLEPAAVAARLESRRLNDPGLQQFMAANLGKKLPAWPLRFWTPKELALAAYYFNPQMQVARAQAQAAQATVITAGERPNPTVGIKPGIPSPYLFSLDLLLPIVTAHKRQYRVAGAQALSEAAHFQLAAAAWKVRGELRDAALSYFLAQRRLWIAETRDKVLSQRVRYLSGQLAAGETARPAVETARLEWMQSATALARARGRIEEARAAMAAAIGVPVAALRGIAFSWTPLDNPPSVVELSPALIERQAVINRLDVRQKLAEYAAAQAELQLQIARQHPDIRLGPGYDLEEGDNFFTLGLSAVLPVFNRNQGPIAVAVARRKEAAARFLATQAKAIAQCQETLARYRAAYAALQEAKKTLGQMQNVSEPAAQKALQAGETDRLAYNRVLLESATVTGDYLSALAEAQTVLARLEDAVQRPLGRGAFPPPVLNSGKDQKETP